MTEGGEAIRLLVKQMNESKYWFAAIVRKGQSKKLVKILAQAHFQFFLPLSEKKVWIQNRYIHTTASLFEDLLFIYVTESQLEDIKIIKEVRSFLYWMDRPAKISENDIRAIRKFLQKNRSVRVGKGNLNIPMNYNSLPDEWDIEIMGNIVSLPSLGYILYADTYTMAPLQKIMTIEIPADELPVK